jgi:O-antigen/teichoic acid export membrane protein
LDPLDESSTAFVQPAPTEAVDVNILRDARTVVAINTFIRLFSGFLMFVISARFLGPESFSVFATSLALGSIASLVSDYGLPIHTLRAAVLEPTRVRAIFQHALILKLIFSALISLILAITFTFFDVAPHVMLCGCILVAGAFFTGFADLCFLAPRVIEQFHRETAPVLLTSVFSLLMIGSVAAITNDLLLTSLAFLVSRAILLISAFSLFYSLVKRQMSEPIFPGVKRLARNARGNATDGILTNVYIQLDMLLAPLILSVSEAGLYQAGARLIQMTAPLAMIIGSIYIPKIARLFQRNDTKGFIMVCNKMAMEFLIFGLLTFFSVVFFLSPMTVYIFGTNYAGLKEIWPIFACLALIRLGSAGYAMQLVAIGNMSAKVMAQGLAIGVGLFLYFSVGPGKEASYFAWIPVVSAIVASLTMALASVRSGFAVRQHAFFIVIIFVVICVAYFSYQ